MSDAIEKSDKPMPVLVTGGSGFVGSHAVRELVRRGYRPVCLVRDPGKLYRRLEGVAPGRITAVQGSLFNEAALREAAEQSAAAIHLVGIIVESGGQSFSKVHIEGTRRVVNAVKAAGVKRYVHMSALGARVNAISEYHQTKHAAEEYVRQSGLDWTIFRPSIVHGPDGEFMELMKAFSKPRFRPGYEALWLGMPYFGKGINKLQPVAVQDVAACFVSALHTDAAIGQSYDLGGPEQLTWREMYAACSQAITGKTRRQLSVPVGVAHLVASTVMKTPLVPVALKFNHGQIDMSQEDSTCDIRPVEETFEIKLRGFREELRNYAGQIR
jgi:NADH dehydrogenase